MTTNIEDTSFLAAKNPTLDQERCLVKNVWFGDCGVSNAADILDLSTRPSVFAFCSKITCFMFYRFLFIIKVFAAILAIC